MSSSETARDAVKLAEQYRSLLRWYPARWRSANEDAILGMLLDDADRRGVVSLTTPERTTIVIGALRERFFSFERVPAGQHVVLLMGVAFSFFYSFVVSWSPGIHAIGAMGPFANPGVLTGALLAASWVLAAFNAGRSSRMLCWIAFAANLVVSVAATLWHWFGPSPRAAGIFAAVAVLGAVNRKPRTNK